MNRHTGRALSGDDHLGQSVVNILSTPKGTMVMLRDYGSDVPGILDQPMNGETLVDLFQAIAEALDDWEPRIQLERVQLVAASAGQAEFNLTGQIGGIIRQVPVLLEHAA